MRDVGRQKLSYILHLESYVETCATLVMLCLFLEHISEQKQCVLRYLHKRNSKVEAQVSTKVALKVIRSSSLTVALC